jgi:hypothetical protein
MKILHDSDERAINFRVSLATKTKSRLLVRKIKWRSVKNIATAP